MTTENKIPDVNILCQKNSLNFEFLKIQEKNSIDKNYCFRLKIKNPRTNKSVNYYGKAKKVKDARNIAASRAIADNFLSKLIYPIPLQSTKVSTVNTVKPLPNVNQKISNLNQKQNELSSNLSKNTPIYITPINKSSPILNKTSEDKNQHTNLNKNQNINSNKNQHTNLNKNQNNTINKINYLNCDVRSIQEMIAKTTEPEPEQLQNDLLTKYDKYLEPNYVYEAYLIAKKFNLEIDIEMFSNLNDMITIKFKIGNKIELGTSTSEYEAMQIAARKFNLNMFSENDNLIKNTIDYNSNQYVVKLNEIHLKLNEIHLKSNESLDLNSRVLILVDKIKDPLSVFKVQLGNMIAFGIGTTVKEAQNNAAKKLLNSLKKKLDDELTELSREEAKIKLKKMKLMNIFGAIDNLNDDIRMDVDNSI